MKKLLIFIVAYNHENFIEKTFSRIDKNIFKKYETEILISDDSSNDSTLQIINDLKKKFEKDLKVTILSNPKNLGYGGNQKVGYFYAIKNNFDFVALLHGDGQYAPELLEKLLVSLDEKDTMAVFGSRMMSKFGALNGGMPLYKFIGNKILTFLQNKILSANLSEFHSGYRIYKVEALKKIPFYLNSDDYSFDTEIIIQFLTSKFKILEVEIPTYYGDEISYVNGFKYAYQIIRESIKAKIQKFGILYQKKYDLVTSEENYRLKINFSSTHYHALNLINDNSTVLDIGCNNGKLGELIIKKKKCKVYGIDEMSKKNDRLNFFYPSNLNDDLPELNYNELDYVIFLDVIEHLNDPENFMLKLYEKLSHNEKVKVIISTPNISFFIIRFMLLFGSFNYGKRGILDKTHTRLFTFSSFKKLIENSNFEIEKSIGIPAPFPLAIGENFMGNLLLKINNFLIFLWKSFFSYQILNIIKPKKSLDLLLKKAEDEAKKIS